MYQQIRNFLPQPMKRFLFKGFALLHAPKNRIRYLQSLSKKRPETMIPAETSARILDYDFARLPNAYLASVETNNTERYSLARAGHTVGYPAWNLLYYSLLSSFPLEQDREFIIVETGTNYGFSSIILAQALKDAGVKGRVRTVDINKDVVETAKKNVEQAGLSEYIEFHVQDSLAYLRQLIKDTEYIDFAFLDGNHEYHHIKNEFSIIYPRVVSGRGTVYFDNTSSGGVAKALQYIRWAYGGNMVAFDNCSSCPPGDVIWQPTRRIFY